MADARSTRDLDGIPRLGWVTEPTPVTALPRVAESLGVEYVGIKRDDLCEPLHGGSKPRKLDYLLAAPRFAKAKAWASVGAIGSGHLVALTAAAERLERRLVAHVFWTPLSAGTLENLAFTASGPTRIVYYGSRSSLGLRRPTLLFAAEVGGVPMVPAGGTTPDGMLGSVRGGLELAEQVRAGELPAPAAVYVALGSGGTAAGLSVGLAMGGLAAEVVAVAVVERAFATHGRLASLQRAAMARLEALGVRPPSEPARIVIDHRHVGPGYAVTTPAAVAACEALAAEGIALEHVYTGKAMAALFDRARGKGPVVFWNTFRRGPLPHADDWRKRLPRDLARRLEAPAGAKMTRRRALVAGGVAAAAIGLGLRVSGYPTRAGWKGAVLAAWEADVVEAAATVILPPDAPPVALERIPSRIDRYLTGMPEPMLREVHGMLALIEHATTPLGRRLHRFTLLDRAGREAFLLGLDARGGLLAQAYRGIRDLCLLAHYQDPESWSLLGYEGPRVALDYDPAGASRMSWPGYDGLVAPEGTLPRGAKR